MSLAPSLKTLRAQTATANRPSLTLFFLLEGAFLLTLVPHAVEFPVWLTAMICTALGIRAVMQAYRLQLTGTLLSTFLAVVFCALILVQYGGIEGRQAGTAFTAGLLAIKFYEIRRPRDLSLIIFACFFMVMSALLYSQVLELFIYCLIMMWVLTALLLRVQCGDAAQDHLLPMLGKAGLIFLQSLPLMLLLFFCFPRYTGTLSFSMNDAKIGLTDTIAPGSIAKLSLDDSEAMRVRFDQGAIPSNDVMYFRGLVLWNYDNGIWTAGPQAGMEIPNAPAPAGGRDEVDQTITVLPHNQKWLFALDVPRTAPVNESESRNWATFLYGNVVQIAGANKLNHLSRYRVKSSIFPRDEELTDEERRNAVRLPDFRGDHEDARVIALADELHKGLAGHPSMDYVYAVLRYFHHRGFRYSTTPGLLKADWLPDFLLDAKIGFCEHFASAFAVLMRLENVPCRVVAGYVGADYNPYSDLYVVAQSNAHAWDEVWVPSTEPNPRPGQGEWGHWKRIDPTAIVDEVAPGDAARRAADASDPLSQQISLHQPGLTDRFLPLWLKTSLREMQLRRDQVEASWDDLVFSYDPEAQLRLAQSLGLGRITTVGLLGICVLVGGIWFWLFRRWTSRKAPLPPVESLYAGFCRDMAQRGIPRADWEGPLAYTNRVAEAFPDNEGMLRRVGDLVARARYGREPDEPSTLGDLKSLLDTLSASQAAAASSTRRE